MKRIGKCMAVLLVFAMCSALFAGCAAPPAEQAAAPAAAAPAAPAAAAPAAPAAAPAADAPAAPSTEAQGGAKKIAYILPTARSPYYLYIYHGVEEVCQELGYECVYYSSDDEADTQLANAQNAIMSGCDAIIVTPTNSATCGAVLNECEAAGVPVVICDIGTESGEYLTYIASPNQEGSTAVGEIVRDHLAVKGVQGPYGEIAVPLARLNGQRRQAGFKEVMEAAGHELAITIQFSQDSIEEGVTFTQNIITGNPDVVAIWAHGYPAAEGAVQALEEMDMLDDVVVACFDADPMLVDLLKSGKVIACGAQQPIECGRQSTYALGDYFAGKEVPKQIDVPVLLLTPDNVDSLMEEIEASVYVKDLS